MAPCKETARKNGEKFKKILYIISSILFLVVFISVFSIFLFQGIIERVAIVTLVCCGIIIDLYILIGYIWSKHLDRRQ